MAATNDGSARGINRRGSYHLHLLSKASDRHDLYPYVSAVAGLAWPDSPDLPHLPEPDMTFYSPLVAAGTATTNVRIGPVRSETWGGSELYGRYGPNIFGD